MIDEAENEIRLISSPSGALTRSYATSLVRRGLNDLVVKAEADEWCKKGLTLWCDGKHIEAVRCFALGVQADPNHAALQFYLGLAYYLGIGMPERDYAQAAICWRRAAEQGHAQAQNNLAQAYKEGHGVARDYVEAACWYRKAAEQNLAVAQFNLGVLYELGRGLPQDFAQASTWYRKAAEQGYAVAEYNLGGLLRLGRGVTQNDSEAAYWYRRAAVQGHTAAQFNLAAMYGLGQGVPQDPEKSSFWYRKASEQGGSGGLKDSSDIIAGGSE